MVCDDMGAIGVGCENSETSKRVGGGAGAAVEAGDVDFDEDARMGITTEMQKIRPEFQSMSHHRAHPGSRGDGLWKTPWLWITAAAPGVRAPVRLLRRATAA